VKQKIKEAANSRREHIKKELNGQEKTEGIN